MSESLQAALLRHEKEAKAEGADKDETAAYALRYGYVTSKLSILAERMLHQAHQAGTLGALIASVSDRWNGENYINGVKWVMNDMARESANNRSNDPGE